jgi:hypothetical protein
MGSGRGREIVMTRKRHSRAEILSKVREAKIDLAAGVPIEQICIKQQVSQRTLERWLRDVGHSKPDEHPGLKQLEHQIRHLRRTVASLEFDNKVLAEAVRGNF